MLNWKRLASKCAMATHSIKGNSLRTVKIAAHTLFEFEPDDYSTEDMPSAKYKLIFNYIVTLGLKSWNQDYRVNLIRDFMIELRMPEKAFGDALTQCGYTLPTLARRVEEILQKSELGVFRQRGFHSEITTHCEKLFKEGNYLYAVQEASKAYCEAVRRKSGSAEDGFSLMMGVFGKGKKLRSVPGANVSEENLLEGIKFLSAGLIQAFRNPSAHETVKSWEISKEDCLDMLSFTSYLFKQLDKASVYP